MLKYNPKDAVLVWPVGDYQATVEAVLEKKSKQGKDMYEVKLTAYSGEKQLSVTDYIVLPAFTFKLKRFARALGMEERFKAGDFDPSSVCGHNLVVSLEIQEANGVYEERNMVKAYLPKDAPTADPFDDLPF